MKRQVHAVKPRDTILHAREILEEHRINQLPVVVNGKVVGIITDRDLRDAFPSVFDAPGFHGELRKPSRNPEQVPVEEVMTEKVITVSPDEELVAATQLMRRERVAALPVVDAERMVGILTRSDVLDAFVALAEGESPSRPPAGEAPERTAVKAAAKEKGRSRK